jgi:hypothetical protein
MTKIDYMRDAQLRATWYDYCRKATRADARHIIGNRPDAMRILRALGNYAINRCAYLGTIRHAKADPAYRAMCVKPYGGCYRTICNNIRASLPPDIVARFIR